MALEQLLAVRSSRDPHHKELDFMELVVDMNKVQTAKAIRQAKVQGVTTVQRAVGTLTNSITSTTTGLTYIGQLPPNGRWC